MYLRREKPIRTTANYNLGYSWFQKENYTQALSYFEQVTTAVSATSASMEQDAYVRSADCYFMKSDFTKANTMYDNVINNALPQSDYAMFQKAMIAGVKSSANKISTLNTFDKTISKKQSGTADANMEIAQTYIADEKFLSAVPYLDQCFE